MKPFFQGKEESPIELVAKWAQENAKPGSRINNITFDAWKALGRPEWDNPTSNMIVKKLQSLGFK